MRRRLWLIKFIGVIVPRRLRAEWRQEWEAELRYRETLLTEWDKLDRRGKLALLWHSLGAFMDALWLQPKRLEDEMFQDLRYGMRMILNRPGFSAVVVLVLALGIGATSAIFSVVNAVLLRPLPYPGPEQLMMVFSTSEREGRSERDGPFTGPDYLELRKQCRYCAQVAAYTGTGPSNLTGGAEPDRVRVAQVTGNLFVALGAQPILGRTFLPEETGRSLFVSDGGVTGPTAVILSYGLWQRRFGADPAVIGKMVKVEGDACAVIGVAPDGFKFPEEAEAWTPAPISPTRNNSYLRVVARLRPGVTQAQGQAELATIARRLEQEQTDQKWGVNLVPLQEYVVGNVRSSLIVFLGAVSFVLLIACANVANLLLARAATRQKEMAVRAALGAGRLRIIRQLLTESLLLAIAGGALGLSLAFGILKFLLAFAPKEIPRLNAIGIDPWALGFTLLLSVLTGVIFGLTPALQASRLDLNATLKEGGTRATGGASRHRLRGLLVVAEVSMALVLLIGAGLLLKSFTRLRETKLGFNPDHALTACVTLPPADYPSAARMKAYYQQSLAHLAARPETQAVGLINSLPLGNTGLSVNGDLTVEGEPAERPGMRTCKLIVSGDYFRALGVPLLKGRTFNERDTVGSPAVVIISDSLARSLWPNEDAIGKRIDIGLGGQMWREVVGVVGDVRQRELGAPPAMALYQPYQQVSERLRGFVGEMTFVIRTAATPQSFVDGLRSELRAVDRELPLHNVATMEQVVANSVADPRFYTLLLGSFSTLALILAAAGIYSVISYSVTQRTHEIGIRLALGAQSGAILRFVVGQGMALTLTGLAFGLGGAVALTRVLSDFLYQVSVTDPTTFALLSFSLVAVALLACWIPARRATKVDPLVALRRD
ncbi:MAG: ABC transporter permease [Chloracidobacterium sp.]|nr:ABC transporter permease [Chloracidobacterium sp.]